MPVRVRSLQLPIPAAGSPEDFEELLSGGSFRLERIVSLGHASPEGFWYDQEQAEWVLLVQGAASLEIEGQEAPLEMAPGDTVLLPAHCRHRVAATDPDQPTIWLAVHFSDNQPPGPS